MKRVVKQKDMTLHVFISCIS